MNYEDIRIKFYDALKKAKESAKLGYCFYCNKEVTGFCLSHTVPKFVLKNIARKGKIYNTFHYGIFEEMKVIDGESGIKNTGIFKLICRECDSKVFQDYENIENIISKPTNKMMAEIGIKNVLNLIYEERYCNKFYEQMVSIASGDRLLLDNAKKYKYIKETNIRDLKMYLKRFKTIKENDLKSGSKLIFWYKCNYIVPIAFQGAICLYGDLNGRIINNILDKDAYMQYIHICIFPLENESVIMLFRHKDDTKYKKFENQFNKLSLAEQLRLISFIVIEYSEHFYISKGASEEVLKSKSINESTLHNTSILKSNKGQAEYLFNSNRHQLKDFINFPNLLSEEYKIEKEDK